MKEGAWANVAMLRALIREKERELEPHLRALEAQRARCDHRWYGGQDLRECLKCGKQERV